MNYRRKLLLALGAGALALMALMAYQIWSSYRDAIHSAEVKTKDYAEILEARIHATLHRADANLQHVARAIPLASVHNDAVPLYAREWDTKLDAYLLNFPELAAMRITDAGGQVIYTSKSPPSARVKLDDRDYFRALRDNPQADLAYSGAITSSFDGRQRMIVARALRDENNAFYGIVFAAIELERFQKLFQSLDVGAKGNVAIYRRDKFTQVTRWPEVKGKSNMQLSLDNPARTTLVDGNRTATRTFTSNTDGTARIYSFHALGPYPYFVAVGVSRNEALAGWQQRSLITGVSTLLLLGLLIALLFRLWRADTERAGLATIVDASHDAIVSRDLEGKILSWNRGAEKLFGYSTTEVMGGNVSVLVPPDRHHELKIGQRLVSDFSATPYDSVRLTKDGRSINVSISAAPIKDDTGSIKAIALIFRDITERKHTEVLSSRLASIVENSNDAIISRNLEGTIITWNAGAEKILGYTAAEAIGNPVTLTLPPGEPAKFIPTNDALLHGEVVVRESRRKTKDGRLINVWTSLSPIRDGDGKVAGASIIIHDITALKQAQAAMQESEQRFRATFEQAALGIAHFDLEHCNIKVNRRYCEIVGYPAEELIGKPPRQFTHPDDIGMGSDLQRGQVLSGTLDHFSHDLRYVRKDATVVWVRRTESLARSDSGEPLYWIRVIEDITERKADAERYRATFDNAPVGILHTDVAGDRILHANRKLCEMLGYTRDELLARTTGDLLHPDGEGADRHKYRDRLINGEISAFSSERLVRHKDGSQIWVHRTVSMVNDAAGKPLYFIRIVADITERKQSEAMRARLAAIVENSHEAIFSRTLDGTILSWNTGAERMFGYSAAETIGQTIAFNRPLGRPSNLALNNAKLLRGEVVAFESTRMTKDGRVIEVTNRQSPIRDEYGKIVGVSVILQDITELKQMQNALEESEKRFRVTFDQTAVGMVTISLDERYVVVNQKFADMTGYSREILQGMSIHVLGYPEDRAMADAQRQQLISGKIGSVTTERRYIRRDGSVFWVRRALSLARDEQGDPMYFVGASEDITEHKEVEARYRATFDNAPVGILHTSIEGYKILRANRKLCEMLGYTQDELLKMTSAELIPHDLRFTDLPRYKAQILNNEFQSYASEHKFLRKDGSAIWVNRTVSLVKDAAGKPLYFIRIVEDITERKAAEAAKLSLETQLRESQKMEAIGTLAGGIAHDFNNILSAIMGNVELARLDAADNAAALLSLEEIHRAGARARDLVQQILAFSRRQPTTRKPIDLALVIEETVRLLRATLPARLILQAECDPTVPDVLADATQMQQALINLATNAMQAMPSGSGNILIRLDTVMLDAALAQAHPRLRELYGKFPGRMVRLALSDSGPGIDAATLERIFEPFFTTKPPGKGTGLGLSVVHGIVQSHDGAVAVHSEPGNGTTFTLYLPIAAVQTAATESAQSPAPLPVTIPFRTRRVLHIDDDRLQLSLFKRFLERRGYHVSAYHDSQLGLDALRANPDAFDLVLTDYNMPGHSGLEVACQVRAIRSDLAVAVLSGFIDETLQAQANAAGVRALLSKAEPIENLYQWVQQLAQPDK